MSILPLLKPFKNGQRLLSKWRFFPNLVTLIVTESFIELLTWCSTETTSSPTGMNKKLFLRPVFDPPIGQLELHVVEGVHARDRRFVRVFDHRDVPVVGLELCLALDLANKLVLWAGVGHGLEHVAEVIVQLQSRLQDLDVVVQVAHGNSGRHVIIDLNKTSQFSTFFVTSWLRVFLKHGQASNRWMIREISNFIPKNNSNPN